MTIATAVPDSEIDMACRLYVEERLSLRAVATHTSVSHETIRAWLTKRGITIRQRGQPAGPRKEQPKKNARSIARRTPRRPGRPLTPTDGPTQAELLSRYACLTPHLQKVKAFFRSLPPRSNARNRRRQFGDFVTWAEDVGKKENRNVCEFPLDPQDIARYLWHLHNKGLVFYTINAYISVLCMMQVAAGFKNPSSAPQVKEARKALREVHKIDNTTHVRPLSDDDITKVLASLSNPRRRRRRYENAEEVLVRAATEEALFRVMLDTGLRRQETGDLRWTSISENEGRDRGTPYRNALGSRHRKLFLPITAILGVIGLPQQNKAGGVQQRKFSLWHVGS